MYAPKQLSDADLLAEVARLAHSEQEATARLVAHLAELDERRLYLGAGFSSLFTYCCEVLHLSEHETYTRIEAARAARRFPVVLDLLAEGALHLTALRLLAPHLTNENHRTLLGSATHRSKREVEELVARRFPRPDVVSSVRKLPPPRPDPDATAGARPNIAGPDGLTPLKHGEAPGRCPPAEVAGRPPASLHPLGPPPTRQRPLAPAPPSASPAVVPSQRPLVAPLAPDRYEIRFTVGASTRNKLRSAQDLLRHSNPTGDPAEIFDRALTLLLEDLSRRKVAESSRPSRNPRSAADRSRHIPAHVRRAVWLRDGGRCSFLSESGRRCGERGFLAFHHLTPFGVGGLATTVNISLRCRAHNAYEADLFYGPRSGARFGASSPSEASGRGADELR